MYSQQRTETGEALDGDGRIRRRVRQVGFAKPAAVILNSRLLLRVWQFLTAPHSVENRIKCLETTLLLAFTVLGQLS